LDNWLEHHEITVEGCGRQDANIELVEVNGALRLFMGTDCWTDHVYWTWTWTKDAWASLEPSLEVSSGFVNIPYVAGNSARAADTIEIACWNDEFQ